MGEIIIQAKIWELSDGTIKKVMINDDIYKLVEDEPSDNLEDMKRCSECGQVKPITEYYKRKESKDGYNSKCKKCLLKYQKRYRIKRNKNHRVIKEEKKRKGKLNISDGRFPLTKMFR